MTIAERIQLHKLGYTKEEISELAKEGYDPKGLEEPPAEPEPVPEEPAKEEPAKEEPAKEEPPKDDAILLAIKELTKTIQASNLQKDAQPETNRESAEEILRKFM